MGLPAALTVAREKDKRVLDLKDLGDYTTESLIGDIRKFAVSTALQENRKQAAVNNHLTRIIIDRNTVYDVSKADAARMPRADNVTFPNFRKEIRMFYTDTETLKAAVTFAYTKLRKLIAYGPGPLHAKDTIYFWASNGDQPGSGKKFTDLPSVLAWLDKNGGPQAGVRILGPTTEDRRFRIYLPGTGRPKTKWISVAHATRSGKEISRAKIHQWGRGTRVARDRDTDYIKSGFDTIAIRKRRSRRKDRFQGMVAKAVHEIVRDALKRNYRDVLAGYRFVPSIDKLQQRNRNTTKPNPIYGKHIPQLWIGMKVYPQGWRRL